MQISWASLRAVVEPGIGERIAWTHESHLKGRAKLVVGAVKRVTEAAVELADGQSLAYDYLVLAPGCEGGYGKATHATLTARLAHHATEAARVKAAEAVLIIGGGPTGVELAAEIVADLPGKKVTLVQAHSRLLPQLTEAASAAALTELTTMGVTVLLGAKVPPGSSKTDGGQDVAADVVFDCTGSKPATAWALAPGGHAGIKLNEKGFIVVSKALSLPDAPKVYALGDAAETGDAKQGYMAVTNQVPTVVANLLAAVAASVAPPKEAPTGPHGMMLVTLGRANGLAQFPGGYVVSGWWLSWLPTMIKSKSLFIDKVRGEHGL